MVIGRQFKKTFGADWPGLITARESPGKVRLIQILQSERVVIVLCGLTLESQTRLDQVLRLGYELLNKESNSRSILRE